MKHSQPSNVPSGVEPPPTAIHDVDASPVRARAGTGAEAFVVSAYEAHHAEVFAFLARATRDTSVAEDLLQDTFLRLTKEAREGRAPARGSGLALSRGVEPRHQRCPTADTAGRWLGRYGRQDRQELTAPSPEAGVMSREGAAEMERVLEGLSGDARLALLLSGEGFAGEEIAETIGRSAAATRTLLCRARARVRVRRELFAEEAR